MWYKIDHVSLSNIVIWEYIFNGAAFIEKMLRTISDVGKIFLLIKAKDKEAAIHRLKIEVCNNIKIFFLFFVVWVHSQQNE